MILNTMIKFLSFKMEITFDRIKTLTNTKAFKQVLKVSINAQQRLIIDIVSRKRDPLKIICFLNVILYGTWPSRWQIWNVDPELETFMNRAALWWISIYAPIRTNKAIHFMMPTGKPSEYLSNILNLLSLRYLPQPEKLDSKRTNSPNQIWIYVYYEYSFIAYWQTHAPYLVLKRTAPLWWNSSFVLMCVCARARLSTHFCTSP